ncbi:PREDICTED: putative cation exchanger C521.04c [Pygoscelis adeliae]|uniref:putative cation exchanger C521.04c n=1 Tax=Pygoscelis adeliae TaxID=9238 RepID=UPI0004F4DE8B|nr:PREDICTED: putative cation exchanger C521.04c [Pygoscelis adeliae]
MPVQRNDAPLARRTERHRCVVDLEHGLTTERDRLSSALRAEGKPTSPPSCCQQHSDEVCESCVVKTTLTAENAVEANKLSNNYKFGFKKWKSHVTARPWEDRSEIVKELYSDLNVIRGSGGSTVTCGNVLYLLLFGWWLSLLYVLVAAMMFITVVGAPFTEVPLEGEVILCCYRAVNPYYYKYAVDGINVFAVNLLPLVLVTLVLGYVDSHNHLTSSPVKFTLALLSIMPLSYYIGMAIASISAQSNFAVGAVVNATFGSITELTFYITALIKGSREGNRCYAEIVKSALTGTLVGCVLFVPGLCMVIGGIRHQEQRFNSRSAGVSSALLFLSVGGVFAPTLFSKVYGKLVCGECHNVTQNPLGHYLCHNCHFDLMENNGTLFYSHVQPLVYTVSLLLPAAYLIGLFFTLKTHSHIYDIHISDCHMPGHHHSAVVHWSRWRALVILLLSTLCMSACADLATEHISPILTNSTISQYFIGVTVLAMVPELPEIVNGIQFALQNNLSLSIEIGNCIAVQVCMLQIPILVLFTIFYPTNFTLVFSDLHVYASMFSVVLMNYIFMDGKCDYFQGTVLVMVYFILLAVYFFAPSPSGC